MAYKILDLFAGVGGLSLGFELLKDNKGKQIFELYKALEIDKYACDTLRRRYGEERVIEGDITDPKTEKKIINECKGRVDIVVGGIPCQSFSLLGPRSGYGVHSRKFKEDKRDTLYEHYRDIVKNIKPKIIVIENVRGILSKKDSNGTRIINKLINDFEKIGYSFENSRNEKWHILNAADYGVPQRRERVILIGILNTGKPVIVPDITPTHFDPAHENAEEMFNKGLKPYIGVSEAIGDLPRVVPMITNTGLTILQTTEISEMNRTIFSGVDEAEYNKDDYRRHLAKISESAKDFFRFVRPNGYKYVHHHTARSHQLSDVILFRLMKQGETAKEFSERMPLEAKKLIKYDMRSFKDKYRKQKSSEPCTTIFAHLEKDGNRFIHPIQARTFTPREAARIQSFPDDFVFEGPISRKFKQIGNAVPPLMSYNIAKTIYFGLL